MHFLGKEDDAGSTPAASSVSNRFSYRGTRRT